MLFIMFPPLLQWNCRSIRHKKQDLIYLINSHKPLILAIQETWLKPGALFRVPGYACFRDDRDDGHAGSCILISRSLSFTQISLPPHSDSFNIVGIKTLNISFLSIYIPVPSPHILSELCNIFNSIPSPVVILGDFNIHHTSWGSHFCDTLSAPFIDILDDLNLCFMNDGTPTRRVSPTQNCHSAIDLSICSPDLSSLLHWKVLDSSFGSDHFPILIFSPNSTSIQYTFNPRLKHNLKRADWSLYAQILDREVDQLQTLDHNNIISIYSAFRNYILSSADKSIPLKKPPKKNIRSPPWWDQACLDACLRRKEAEKSYKIAMTLDNYLNYKRIAAETLRLLAQKKKDGWRGFCEALSPRTPPSLVWRQVRKFRCSTSVNTQSSSDATLWSHEFANRLAPPTAPTRFEACIYSTPVVQSNSPFDAPFSYEELVVVLNNLKDSAPGYDGIPYSFIVKSNLRHQAS